MAQKQSSSNTDQMEQQRDEKGRITGGVPPAGFNKHPENRNPGGWVKSDTPRFKLEQMMKLNVEELTAIVKNPKTPLFEIRMANAIKNGDWRIIDGMINQVYGKPKETVDYTMLEPPKPLEDLRKGK